MQLGEIIALGRHRLMCGDATSRDDVMRLIGDEKVNLVLTDPPYGNSRNLQHKDGALGGNKDIGFMHTFKPATPYPQVIGNDTTDSAREYYGIAKGLAERLIFWGGNYFADFLPVSRGWLYWDKQNSTTDFSDGELAWSNIGTKIKKYEFRWNGFCREGNKELNAKIHPNQKPVELHMKILEDFTQPDDVILDCFGGSGTTLIACEMTGRRCLMMEISPEYCEIIAGRYGKVKAEYPLIASSLK